MLLPVASKIRKPRRPSMVTSAKSHRLAEMLGGRQQGFELKVGQPQGRGLGWHVGPPDVLGRRVLEDAIDHTGPAGNHRHPP